MKQYIPMGWSLFFVSLSTIAHLESTDILQTFITNGSIVKELTTNQYIELIRPFLPIDPIILEAGCNNGTDSVLLAQGWPQGTIYAFEPIDHFVKEAKARLHKAHVTNVTIFPVALFSTSGKKTFYYSTAIPAASSLLESNHINDYNGNPCDYKEKSTTVEAVNLDEWAQTHKVDHIDYMWLDMEGAEFHALSGAPHILSTVRVISSEVNFQKFRKGMTQYNELYTLLSDNGFTLYKIWGNPHHQGTALFVRTHLLETLYK